eukprot:TRINITY_DN303_c1_g1_i2.p1 TRINITY_DN303_c1_g1~~TRINITY_DN303_c1_g1_i2.p1  ORF type:complete len:150 (+),score=36.00 TRINITY_DN303_c1_g1_i2:81-530(+)
MQKSVARWFFRENGDWHVYPLEASEKMEELYQRDNHGNFEKVKLQGELEFTLDFRKMKSFKEGASKKKKIHRASWFYMHKTEWEPFEEDLDKFLEDSFQAGMFDKGPVHLWGNTKEFVTIFQGDYIKKKISSKGSLHDVTLAVNRGWPH